MSSRHITAVMLLSTMLASCTQQGADRFRAGVNQYRRDTDPRFAARQDYDRAVADYQACLQSNPTNAASCDGQRQIMDADAQVLASVSRATDSTTVNVGR